MSTENENLSVKDWIKFRHCFEFDTDKNKTDINTEEAKEVFFDKLVEAREKYPCLHNLIKQIADSEKKYKVFATEYQEAFYSNPEYYSYEIEPPYRHTFNPKIQSYSNFGGIIFELANDLRDQKLRATRNFMEKMHDDKLSVITELVVRTYETAENQALFSFNGVQKFDRSGLDPYHIELYEKCKNDSASLKEAQMKYIQRFVSDFIQADRTKVKYKTSSEFDSSYNELIGNVCVNTKGAFYAGSAQDKPMTEIDAIVIKAYEKDFAERYGGKIDLMSAYSERLRCDYSLPISYPPKNNINSRGRESR